MTFEQEFAASMTRRVIVCQHLACSRVHSERFDRFFVCFDCDSVLENVTNFKSLRSSRKLTSRSRTERRHRMMIFRESAQLRKLAQVLALSRLSSTVSSEFARAKRDRIEAIVNAALERSQLALDKQRAQAARERSEFDSKTLRTDKRASLAYSSELTRQFDRLDESAKQRVRVALLARIADSSDRL